MIQKEGKDKQELINILEEISELTKVDSLVKSGEKFSVKCRKEGKQLNWTLESERTNLKKGRIIATGKNFQKLFDTLESINEDSALLDAPDCVVLCYVSVEQSKDWQENVISHWIEINPCSPYELKDGQPHFKVKTVTLPEEDFRMLSQTGLAFYCETTDIYYPITELSFDSIGRLFDCTMAFSRLDSHMLGSALLLAEKISYTNKLRVIHRASGKIRPVLAVIGRKYCLFSQNDFFKRAMENAAAIGVYEINKWSIDDELSTLELKFPNFQLEKYHFGMIIQTSDIPKYSFKVETFVELNGACITLLMNKASHNVNFNIKSIDELFYGAKEAMLQFSHTYDNLKKYNCYFDKSMLKKIHMLLGKKRTAGLKEIKSGILPAQKLYDELLETRYIKIKDQQFALLKVAFKELLDQIANNLEEEAVMYAE